MLRSLQDSAPTNLHADGEQQLEIVIAVVELEGERTALGHAEVEAGQ